MQNYEKKTETSIKTYRFAFRFGVIPYFVKIVHTQETLRLILDEKSKQGLTIGFVPTMGALHAGHMALIEQAKKVCDIVVASVFVNPTQFNNPDDLLKYPRTPEKDAELLECHGCDVAFFPNVEAVYPAGYETPKLDLKGLDTVMEGAFRPGHFDGVVQVVNRLFELVQPTKAFFGLKDFQQVAVIRFMTKAFNWNIEIVPCPTLRETSGLAMSSRNMRLTDEQKEDALIIFKTMSLCAESVNELSPKELKSKALHFFETGKLKLEYLEIVDPTTLVSLDNHWVSGAVVCIAAYAGEVRLIDNLILPVEISA